MNYQPIKTVLNAWLKSPATDARRFFHGRGHLYEGLEHINIDWYPPILLISAYAELQHPDSLIQLIKDIDALGQIKSIVIQNRYQKGAPAKVVYGESTQFCIVNEGRLRFEIHPGQQQNAGLFLDMRPLREWLQENSQNKNMLNLFAYTCSLSVAALAGGATQAVNVDMSKTSIKWGERNHALNAQDLRSVHSMPHNIFKSWGRIKQYGKYDTIIIDPPTRQKGSFDAEKNYPAVLKKLYQLAQPGANVIATVNSPYLGTDYLPNLAQRYAPKFKYVGEFPASPEFKDKFPGRGLKIFHFRLI